MSKTILIDVDDTIENLCDAWCKWLNNKYNTDVKSEDITDWNISRFFDSLSEEQVFEPLHNEEFWKTVEPKPDAAEYIKRLMADGYNVYLCTTTDYRNVKPKFEYIIKKHFPFISWEQVIVTSHKQMVKADFLIDDGVHNLRGGDYFKILMSAPHNREVDAVSEGMFRVDNWKEIYQLICEIITFTSKNGFLQCEKEN